MNPLNQEPSKSLETPKKGLKQPPTPSMNKILNDLKDQLVEKQDELIDIKDERIKILENNQQPNPDYYPTIAIEKKEEEVKKDLETLKWLNAHV